MNQNIAHHNRRRDIALPSVIVLCNVVTGLATARSISDGGVKVHAAIFNRKDPIRFSRCCQKIDFSSMGTGDELINHLVAYARNMNTRPFVIPTSDEHALLLAKNYSRLSPYCLLWKTPYEVLKKIINKHELYTLARTAGVNIVPAIVEPNPDQLARWVKDNTGPYFLKPFYEGISICKLKEKNLVVETKEQLIEYVARNGATGLVVQRFIQGGDGYIFDTYGLCDRNGDILTIATHRRWRQNPPDTGTTSFGEIPARPEGKEEDVLFEYTGRLLDKIRYHGIFGIEWLQDRKTGELYIIDFNARPFTSIGHLTACGLNLPLLAYREAVGDDLSDIVHKPILKHLFWIDFLSDLWWVQQKRKNHDFEWAAWMASIMRLKRHAYLSWRDPGPGAYRIFEVTRIIIRTLRKKLNVDSTHPERNENHSPLAPPGKGTLLPDEKTKH